MPVMWQSCSNSVLGFLSCHLTVQSYASKTYGTGRVRTCRQYSVHVSDPKRSDVSMTALYTATFVLKWISWLFQSRLGESSEGRAGLCYLCTVFRHPCWYRETEGSKCSRTFPLRADKRTNMKITNSVVNILRSDLEWFLQCCCYKYLSRNTHNTRLDKHLIWFTFAFYFNF